MSISNTWANTGLRSDQSMYRKLMRDTSNDANAGIPTAQLTITVTSTAPIGNNGLPDGQIEVGREGRTSMMAALNSQGFGDGPPPPPSSGGFASDISALFQALESGDTETATRAADQIQSVLDTFEALSSGATQPTDEAGTSETTEATEATQTAATDTDTDTDTTTEPDFITALKAILAAVADGDFETATAEASAVSETLASLAPPSDFEGRPSAPMVGDIMLQVGSLLEAVDSGDTETAATLAASLRDALPDLDTTSTVADGSSFETDLAALLNAVEAGKTEDAEAAAATIGSILSMSRSENPDDASETSNTITASIDAALTSLGETSSESSTGTNFLDNLKALLEALKSGTDVDQKLQSVISAYTAEQSATD